MQPTWRSSFQSVSGSLLVSTLGASATGGVWPAAERPARWAANMTLLHLLTAICFTSPPFVGIVAGMEAGVVGIMVGTGVGLVAGGLAYYSLKKTAEYSYKLEGRRKSQPKVVQVLIDLGTEVWIVFLILGAALVSHFLGSVLHLHN